MLAKNVGALDRAGRAYLGAGLLACSVRRLTRSQGNTLGSVGAIAGAALLFTAVTGFCSIHAALDIDTSK